MKLFLYTKAFILLSLVSSSSLFAIVTNVSIPNLSGVTVLTSPTYQTGIDAFGNSTIAYAFVDRSQPTRNIFLQAVTLDPFGNFLTVSPAFELDPSITGINIPNRTFQLAVSSLSRDVLLVWTVKSSITNRITIQAAFLDFSTLTWTQSQLSDDNFNITDFNAAIDDLGNSVVAWRVPNGLVTGSRNVVQASYKAVSGDWPEPSSPNVQDNTLSSPFFNVTDTPSVGIGNGNATVAWQIFNGSATFQGTNVVQAAFKTPTGSFQVFDASGSDNINPQNPDTLLSPLNFRVASAPRVTARANTAVITWQIVGNPNTTLPDNVLQAFIHHY